MKSLGARFCVALAGWQFVIQACGVDAHAQSIVPVSGRDVETADTCAAMTSCAAIYQEVARLSGPRDTDRRFRCMERTFDPEVRDCSNITTDDLITAVNQGMQYVGGSGGRPLQSVALWQTYLRLRDLLRPLDRRLNLSESQRIRDLLRVDQYMEETHPYDPRREALRIAIRSLDERVPIFLVHNVPENSRLFLRGVEIGTLEPRDEFRYPCDLHRGCHLEIRTPSERVVCLSASESDVTPGEAHIGLNFDRPSPCPEALQTTSGDVTPSTQGWSWMPWLMGGIGVAALGGAIPVAVLREGAAQELSSAGCSFATQGNATRRTQCPDAASRAETLEPLLIGLSIGGAALLTTGIVWMALNASSPPRSASWGCGVTPGALSLTCGGRF